MHALPSGAHDVEALAISDIGGWEQSVVDPGTAGTSRARHGNVTWLCAFQTLEHFLLFYIFPDKLKNRSALQDEPLREHHYFSESMKSRAGSADPARARNAEVQVHV